METAEHKYKELTSKIISCFDNVYNELGFGFLEKIYEKSMKIELESCGLKGDYQYPIKVYYKNNVVGYFFADILVENSIIVEIKSVEAILKEHELHLMNFLKATNFEAGLLLNFGKKPEIKRKFHTK